MRINSGKYKGRKLIGYTQDGIRPTKNLVKESVVAIIQNDLVDATVLDLFAGTGAIGLEMLSCGASKVYLNDLTSKQILTSNSKNMEGVIISSSDALPFLKKVAKEQIRFDIIYIDPPYLYPHYLKVLRYIKELNLLNDDGYLIVESDHDQSFDSSDFNVVKQKKYGNTLITILTIK